MMGNYHYGSGGRAAEAVSYLTLKPEYNILPTAGSPLGRKVSNITRAVSPLPPLTAYLLYLSNICN